MEGYRTEGDHIVTETEVDGIYLIQSGDSGEIYAVDGNRGACSCPHSHYRQARCKHLDAADQYYNDCIDTGEPELLADIQTVDDLNELLFG